MAQQGLWTGPCFARVRVDRDFLADYEDQWAYWKQHGINARYLNVRKGLAFNCALIGEDLLHSDPTRREEAKLAMMTLYLYPVATMVKRRWHFPDDPPGDYEKSWDAIKESVEVIRDALQASSTSNSRYNPTEGDVCHYLLWPRIGWHKSKLERTKFGRSEASKQLADWQNHPYCGQFNCPVCAARSMSLESYAEDGTDDTEENPPTISRSRNIETIRLPGDVQAFPERDPVGDGVLREDRYWWQLAKTGLLSTEEAQLMDLRFAYEMQHKEIASRWGKPLSTILKRSSRTMSRIETDLSTCIINNAVDVLFCDRSITYSDHDTFVHEAMRRALSNVPDKEGTIEPITASVHAGRLNSSSSMSTTTLLQDLPGPILALSLWKESDKAGVGSDGVHSAFQHKLVGHPALILVGGTLTKGLINKLATIPGHQGLDKLSECVSPWGGNGHGPSLRYSIYWVCSPTCRLGLKQGEQAFPLSNWVKERGDGTLLLWDKMIAPHSCLSPSVHEWESSYFYESREARSVAASLGFPRGSLW